LAHEKRTPRQVLTEQQKVGSSPSIFFTQIFHFRVGVGLKHILAAIVREAIYPGRVASP